MAAKDPLSRIELPEDGRSSILNPPRFDGTVNVAAAADSIGKLKGLLDELADRDAMAMRASLEQTKTLVRGQPPILANIESGSVPTGASRSTVIFRRALRRSSLTHCDADRALCMSPNRTSSLPRIRSAGRIVKRISGKPTDAPLKLLAIEAGTPESFVLDLQTSVRQLPENERDLVLFIHGFNVDFDSARSERRKLVEI